MSEERVSTDAVGRHARLIHDKTRGRIRSYLQSKDEWNLSRSLKNLIEQAVRDYEHRALVELLQNAHDAHDPGDRTGRVFVRLDHDYAEHGVLYVANTGRGFTDSNFDAISDIAQSDKRPEEGIGNKGIGFKSVLQLSRSPEVYSTSDDSGRLGYCFRFANVLDILDHLNQLDYVEGIADAAADVERDVFHLCLPVAQYDRPPVVDEFLAAGYATVVRLPLKSEEARAEAVEQLRQLDQDPPALLFLRRIARLTIEEIQQEQVATTVLERTETSLVDFDDITVATVTLGAAGTYLLANKTVPAETFADAITRSIAGDHISEGWQDWRTEAHVAVALRLDAELDTGRLYTYLPMGADAHAPLPAHVNAPFFAKLARVNLEESVPLNDTLLDQVAELCARLLLAAPNGSLPIASDVLVDLLSWSPPSHARLQAAFARLGDDVATARVVPLAGPELAWGSLSTAFLWDDTNRDVITTARLATRARVPVIVAGLSMQRAERLDQAARRLVPRRLTPADTDIAAWAERVAQTLASAPFDAGMWGAFYDELASAISHREVLHGRKILVDDDGKLRRCNSKAGDGRAAVAFFSPRADSDSKSGGDTDLKPPARLRRRLFFVSSQIAWNRRSGGILHKRPGRRMLEDGLVHEYRATDLLPVIANALERKPTPELAADILMWSYRFAASREDPPWHDIRNMRLRVPVRDRHWIRADQAHLSKAWGGDEVTLLDELLSRVADLSEDLAELRRRLTIDPTDIPFNGQNPQQLRNFLVHIGVRTGLSPDPVSRSTLRADGRDFEAGYAPVPPQLPIATTSTWRAALAEQRPTHLRPYTAYVSQTPLYRLPGQDDHVRFPPAARLLYARLVAHGLSTWPDETLAVTLRRYNDGSDKFTLPTPVGAFLTQSAWTPIAAPGERTKLTYVRPAQAWSHVDDAPPFASVIASQVRRVLHARPLSDTRTRQLRVRSWDDPATAGDRVRLLAALLESGEVPNTVLPQFRAAYEDAWIAAVTTTSVGTPLDSGTRASLVVARGSLLDVVDLRATGDDAPIVYVQDGDARQNLHLLEQCGLPLLRLRHTQAVRVADRLAQSFGARIRRVSNVAIIVRTDGSPFTASIDSPLLVTAESEWLVDLIAAVLELRSTRFRPTGPDALRRAIARLRRIRLVLADHIQATIDGHPVAASAGGTRWLTVAGKNNPTVIVRRRTGEDDRGLLERAIAPVAELLGYSELGDAMRVALIDLASAAYGPTNPPGDEAIAQVMGESVARITEIRLAIRRPDEVTLEVLIPLVAVFDATTARQLDAGEAVSFTPTRIAEWLATRARIDVAPSELLTAAADGLDTARRLLGIALEELNAAIRQLGAPYRQLRDADAISQQFRHAVAVHTAQIFDALRTAHLADYQAGRPLDAYLEHRTLNTLTPDPSWAEHYYPYVPDSVILAQINHWLTALGAPELGGVSVLEPLDSLRSDNRAHLLGWLRTAIDVIRAYEHSHELAASGLPGDPAEIADTAAAQGLLDFETVSVERVLDWLAATGRWPAGMPTTLDPAALRLPPDALTHARHEQDQARRRRDDERRRITIDGHDMDADESNYAQIIDAIRAGITDEFRNTRGGTVLTELPPQQRRTLGGGQPGTTAGRRSKPSESQTAAIGLAGEIAALEWIKARYPDVSELQAWKSGYRNQVLGDAEGDDTLGYDIVIDDHKHRLMFEVKATTGDQAEFLLTDIEIARAQNLKKREQYQILFVTHVFDSDMRRIHLLPNPLDARYSHLYRTVGDGVRYRFKIGGEAWHASDGGHVVGGARG